MKNKNFKDTYISIHENIIDLLNIAKKAYLVDDIVDRYSNTEKAISLLMQLQEEINKVNEYKFLADTYRNLYINLDIFLTKKNEQQIDFVIHKLEFLSKIYINDNS